MAAVCIHLWWVSISIVFAWNSGNYSQLIWIGIRRKRVFGPLSQICLLICLEYWNPCFVYKLILIVNMRTSHFKITEYFQFNRFQSNFCVEKIKEKKKEKKKLTYLELVNYHVSPMTICMLNLEKLKCKMVWFSAIELI